MLVSFKVLFLFTTFLGVLASSDNRGKDDNGKDDNNDHGNNNDPHNPHNPPNPPIKIVKGKVFDRIVTIWLENTDFEPADADPNMKALAKKGLTLTNYFAVAHPSEPNYVATVGGEYFGMNNDDLLNIPSNVSTVVDLLEEKGISWANYQEHMPSTGFEGFEFRNQQTGANDYVRKHNPLIIYQSITKNPRRLANNKNFTLFERELAANRLPQWMFMTPNMTNDGHDTGVTFSSQWARGFIEPLLENKHFNTEKTIIMLSFDECGSARPNRVFTILFGGAVPKHLIGKTDNTFYHHYSPIATVEANWHLHTLGRWDVGANVFGFVAEKTGDRIRQPDKTANITLNLSYPGILNNRVFANQPVPNTKLVINGRTVLPAIQKEWASQVRCTGYHGQLIPPSGLTPPLIPSGC